MAPTSSKSGGSLSDLEADEDQLDFTPYTDTLVDIIRDPSTVGPFVVGVFGAWGSGKTSLMRFVERRIRKAEGAFKEFRVVWFDAWKFEKEDALWRALLFRVVDELRVRDKDGKEITGPELRTDIERLEQRLYRDLEWEEKGALTVDWRSAWKLGLGTAVRLSFACLPGGGILQEAVKAAQGALGKGDSANELVDTFRRDVIKHHQAQLRSIEQFQHEFGALIKKHILANNQRLVVFVDDLDRCLPEKAIEVLEAVKLFLDVKGCIFLLGLDQDVVERGIKVKYRDFAIHEAGAKQFIPIDGAQYLEKIIQLPFRLPKIGPEQMNEFIGKLGIVFPDERCGKVFAEGLETNPRKIKRAINIFSFISKLAERREIVIKPVRLAKVVAIYHSHPAVYELLRSNPALLLPLEKHFRAQVAPKPAHLDPSQVTASPEPTPIDPTLLSELLKRILTLYIGEADDGDLSFISAEYDEVASYFTLTRGAIQATQTKTGETAEAAIQETYTSMPVFVPIAGGQFLMGTSVDEIKILMDTVNTESRLKIPSQPDQSYVEIGPYEIAKYPVTNAEYHLFTKQTKTRPPDHWSGPIFPEALGAHPVVSVFWSDAVAYCEWLTRIMLERRLLREDEVIRLPTEEEWEKAAAWDERRERKRVWPWGNEWDASRCNCAETGPNTTTPVGKFSTTGDSFYGVSDMAGNVSEWCVNFFEPPRPQSSNVKLYATRGGYYGGDLLDVRCSSREGQDDRFNYSTMGFRCVKVSVTPPVQ